eukprot:gb/GFBE01028208.1/.p1 GENE.gb/GFBE01028208.1/~~gb/GFBE01028208.1/.p1  ORF type:complete len:584 (+),score=106.16 gb/GFBE01028208.1/:1-1752(+)
MADQNTLGSDHVLRCEISNLIQAEFTRLSSDLREDIRCELRVAAYGASSPEHGAASVSSPVQAGLSSPSEAWQPNRSETKSVIKSSLLMRGHKATKVISEMDNASKAVRRWKSAPSDRQVAPYDSDSDPECPSPSRLAKQATVETTLPGTVSSGNLQPPAAVVGAGGLLSRKAPAKVSSRKPARSITSEEAGANKSWLHKKITNIVCSLKFEILVMVIIFLNSIILGAQTNLMAQEKLRSMPVEFRVCEIVYLVLCCLEVLARLYAHRLEFFTMWGWQWNVFDLFLVIFQLTEEALMATLSEAGKTNLDQQLALVSIVRILRCIRLVRVLKVLQRAQDLRLIVSCIISSFRPLFWSSVCILIMTYIVSLYFTQTVTAYLADYCLNHTCDPLLVDQLEQLYGSLWKSVLALFQGISGGHDWDTVVDPLKVVSPWATFLLVCYIGFAIIAVMNIITALFVESATERGKEVKQVMLVSHIRSIFESLDLDTSGNITYEEFLKHAESQVVQDWFQAMDIDASEAKVLFQILDTDETGKIDFEGFLHGCMRLQSPVMVADILFACEEILGSISRTANQLNRVEAKLFE